MPARRGPIHSWNHQRQRSLFVPSLNLCASFSINIHIVNWINTYCSKFCFLLGLETSYMIYEIRLFVSHLWWDIWNKAMNHVFQNSLYVLATYIIYVVVIYVLNVEQPLY
jgi:hypothetical protein